VRPGGRAARRNPAPRGRNGRRFPNRQARRPARRAGRWSGVWRSGGLLRGSGPIQPGRRCFPDVTRRADDLRDRALLRAGNAVAVVEPAAAGVADGQPRGAVDEPDRYGGRPRRYSSPRRLSSCSARNQSSQGEPSWKLRASQ